MTRSTEVARRLRRDATHAEQVLWLALREAALPARFRRQHPIGTHVADFACPAARLVVELDGGQHAGAEEADVTRTAALARHGYRVIRFWNHDVLAEPAPVVETIARELTISLSAPRGRRGSG
ncbi:MAG: endonuclease domain-containing protein [Alphaproteobacteria bacterium]